MEPLQPGDIIIDISKHNGVIDFAKLKPHVKGVILKATEGATVLDKKFFANVNGCVDNGIPWSAYHFATWNNEDERSDAISEAKFFLSVIKGAASKPELPLVLDIESNKPIPYTKQEMVDYCSAFTGEVYGAEYEPAIYGSPGFLNSYLPTNHPFTTIKLWVADYTGSINPVPGWKKVWLHQFTDQGTIAGVNGNCDINRIITP